LTISSFTNIGEDLGYALNEVELVKLGEVKLNEFIAVENGNAISDILFDGTIASLYVKNGDTYALDFMAKLNDVEVGTFMGMNKCDANCTLEHTHQSGWYDKDGNLITKNNISSEIMLNLYDVTMEKLTSGEFEITNITTDSYLGKSFGYTVGSKSGYCDSGCIENHAHEFYWIDADNKFVGEMNNAISNVSLKECIEDGIDLNDLLAPITIGDIMGLLYCDGTACLVETQGHEHSVGWYDDNGNLISDNSIGNEIILKLYDMTFDEFSNGKVDITKLSEDIYFGKAFGYKVENKTGYCDIDCDIEHEHKFYWVDNEGKFAGELNNAMANITLIDAMEGNVIIDNVISNVKLGSIIGKEYIDGNWHDKNGNVINYEELGGGDKILYKLYNTTVGEFKDNFNFEDVIGDMYVGEVMGYKGSVGAWLKPNGTDYVNASAMEMVVADILMEDMLKGKVDIRAKIDELTLSDVIDIGDSAILKLLKDKQIKNLSTEIDKLNVGEIMNYVKCTNDSACPLNSVSGHVHDGGWYEEDGTKVTGLYSALSKYNIGELFGGTAKIDELKI
ncbi:MAG: hypothetical protein J6R29_05260, partial [Clostridia bacterium]|nr:hypothetical protein [Clostridia bacterium]